MTLSLSDFQRLLHNGMGRAILYLQQHDSDPYRDVILYTCLHNTAYDPQVEGTHAQYIFDVIQLTSDFEFYRDEILSALSQVDQQENWPDDYHLLDLAVIFAMSGDERARQIIYNLLLIHPTSDLYFDALIKLDGINGLITLIDKIWSSSQSERDDLVAYGSGLLDLLEKRDGADQTQYNLKELSNNNSFVKEFVDSVTLFQSDRSNHFQRKKRSQISYHELKIWMSTSANFSNPPVEWSLWGKYASDEDIALAADDLMLLQDEDVHKITLFLKMFQNRMFPLVPTRLIEWARQIDGRSIWLEDGIINYEVRRALFALNALELVMDWSVRDLALYLIETQNNAGRAVGLLGLNFVEGDWQIIEGLSQSNINHDDYHALGLNVLDLCEARLSIYAVSTLNNLYEFSNCSRCRHRFVEQLAALNTLPDWIIEECKFDCNLDLRQWAHSISATTN